MFSGGIDPWKHDPLEMIAFFFSFIQFFSFFPVYRNIIIVGILVFGKGNILDVKNVTFFILLFDFISRGIIQ